MADRAFQAEHRRCLAEYSICRKRLKRLGRNCSLLRSRAPDPYACYPEIPPENFSPLCYDSGRRFRQFEEREHIASRSRATQESRERRQGSQSELIITVSIG